MRYDAIYLSPHLDDAALSCGGQIYQHTHAGLNVLIVTIMAGEAASVSDYADALHDRWELANDVVAQRRAEDIEACKILGADHLHLDVPDCIYRLDAQGKPYYQSDDDIFGEVATDELELIEAMAHEFKSLPSDAIVAPLCVGNHVDHQIVRAAAQQAFGKTMFYYEDYPYARKAGAVSAVIRSTTGRWDPIPIPLFDEALKARQDAVAAFKSQLSSFFEDRADLDQQIADYAHLVGGERIWLRN